MEESDVVGRILKEIEKSLRNSPTPDTQTDVTAAVKPSPAPEKPKSRSSSSRSHSSSSGSGKHGSSRSHDKKPSKKDEADAQTNFMTVMAKSMADLTSAMKDFVEEGRKERASNADLLRDLTSDRNNKHELSDSDHGEDYDDDDENTPPPPKKIALEASDAEGDVLDDIDGLLEDLNTQFRSLCSSQVPVTSLLFGDSLAQTLKDITETSKVGAKVGASSSSYKGKGGQPSSRGKHFLGRHRPQSGFRNHQYGGRGRSSYYHNSNPNSYENPKKQTT